MRSTTKPSWLPASSASANRNRSSRSFTNSRRVQKNDATPSCRLPVAGRRSRLPGRTGARSCTLSKGSARRPSLA